MDFPFAAAQADVASTIDPTRRMTISEDKKIEASVPITEELLQLLESRPDLLRQLERDLSARLLADLRRISA